MLHPSPHHITVLLISLCTATAYVHRVSLSLALVSLSNELSWQRDDDFRVLSGFYRGYLVTQFLGPLLASALGAKKTLLLAQISWSLLTLTFPLCARHSPTYAMLSRVLMGCAQGVTFPVAYYMLRATVPEAERSRSIASVSLGNVLGTSATFALSPLVMDQLGWPAVFFLIGGALGPAVCFLWHRGVPDDLPAAPSSKPAPSDSFLASNLALFRNPLFVSIFLAHFTHNLAHFGLIAWSPLFLKDFGFRTDQLWMGSLPWAAQAVAVVVSSWLVDRAIAQRPAGQSVLDIRRRFTSGCMGLAGACWLGIGAGIHSGALVSHAALIALLAGGVACNGAAAPSGYESCKLDATDSPAAASRLQSMANFLSTFAGVLGVEMASNLDWAPVFAFLGAAFFLVAAAFWRWAV